MIESPTFMSVG